MKNTITMPLVVLTVLLGGCAGSGPNTQQGAVGGALAGAVAGAVIGNNNGHHNTAEGALIGGAVGAVAGAAIGNSLDHQRGTLYTSETQATSNVVVREAPPMPTRRREARRERDPRDGRSVWVEGHWVYTNENRYEWMEGHWVTPPDRYRTFVEPHWSRRPEGYVYVQGYWR